MKNQSILKFIVIALLLLSQLPSFAHTIICREKAGGDKTNKFKAVTRTVSEGAGITSVSITCVDPGDNPCPNASPVQPGDGEGVDELALDPALANHANEIFTHVDEQFGIGVNSGSDCYTLEVTLANGTTANYYVTYSWELTTSGNEKATIEILPL